MNKQIIFVVILFLGAAFNAFVMPRRIRRQVGDHGLTPKMARGLCLLWYGWAAAFFTLGVVLLSKLATGK